MFVDFIAVIIAGTIARDNLKDEIVLKRTCLTDDLRDEITTSQINTLLVMTTV